MENSLVNLIEIINKHYLQDNPEEYNGEKLPVLFSDEEKRNILNRKRRTND